MLPVAGPWNKKLDWDAIDDTTVASQDEARWIRCWDNDDILIEVV